MSVRYAARRSPWWSVTNHMFSLVAGDGELAFPLGWCDRQRTVGSTGFVGLQIVVRSPNAGLFAVAAIQLTVR